MDATELIAQLKSTDPADEQFEAELLELKISVDEHVDMEEQQLFPKLQNAMSESSLGNDLEASA